MAGTAIHAFLPIRQTRPAAINPRAVLASVRGKARCAALRAPLTQPPRDASGWLAGAEKRLSQPNRETSLSSVGFHLPTPSLRGAQRRSNPEPDRPKTQNAGPNPQTIQHRHGRNGHPRLSSYPPNTPRRHKSWRRARQRQE